MRNKASTDEEDIPPDARTVGDPSSSNEVELLEENITISLSANKAASLAVAFPLLGGIVFWLVAGPRHPFVRFWAGQSILLGLLFLGGAFLLGIIGSFPLIGKLIHFVVGGVGSLVFLAVWIFQIKKAFEGKRWAIPGFKRIRALKNRMKRSP